MTVTAKDLRFNVSMLFDVLITYRGKAKAKLIPYDAPNNEPKDDAMFGMWNDRDESVDEMVRGMRAGRNFDLWCAFRYRCHYLVFAISAVTYMELVLSIKHLFCYNSSI